jgi:hypothetical protein
MTHLLRSFRLLTAVLCLTAAAMPAAACSCPGKSPKAALEAAAAVFSGTVVFVKKSQADVVVTIKVDKVWKGDVPAQVTVSTPPNDGLCGVSFKEGDGYLVYAGGQPGSLSTNICMRTRTLGDAKEDLAAHGAGKSPEKSGK